nr:MAG TPA: hypothetical protein [Caudoviricetes sp.]
MGASCPSPPIKVRGLTFYRQKQRMAGKKTRWQTFSRPFLCQFKNID